MAKRRCELIDSETPGYYHLTTRCVRRAFLCGVDEQTGRSYEHRREWIEARILALAEIFSIEVYSYAVMHNHYHLVVYSAPLAPASWSDEEVAERWLKLYPGKQNHPQYAQQRALKRQTILNTPSLLAEYRRRLGSLSWLMACINEPIAKRSNREDCVKGHFWEARFTSQALLDESAALTCMAYVDLNPIRAGMTQTLQGSEFTSIKKRIHHLAEAQLQQPIQAMAGQLKTQTMTIRLGDYIQLVEWTGKQIVHPDKAAIPADIASVLTQLELNQDNWLNQVKAYGRNYYRAVGPISALISHAKKLQQQYLKGIKSIQSLYISPT